MPKIIFTNDAGQKTVSQTLDTVEEKLQQIKELKIDKKLREAQEEIQKLDKSGYNRARSVTVGTAFGGVVELSMRSDHTTLWCVMQPTEVIEIIHQLAGSIGCHINIKPRNDFASWRGWRADAENLLPFMSQGWAPHPTVDQSQSIGMSETMAPSLKIQGENNETLAITKTINKRKSKRTPTSS